MASPATQRGCIALRLTHECDLVTLCAPLASPLRLVPGEQASQSCDSGQLSPGLAGAPHPGAVQRRVAGSHMYDDVDWVRLGLPCGRADTRAAHPLPLLSFQASLVGVHTAHAPAPRCEKGGTRETRVPWSHLCTRAALLPLPSSRPVAHTHATAWRQTAAARRRLRLGGAACERLGGVALLSLLSLTPVVAAYTLPCSQTMSTPASSLDRSCAREPGRGNHDRRVRPPLLFSGTVRSPLTLQIRGPSTHLLPAQVTLVQHGARARRRRRARAVPPGHHSCCPGAPSAVSVRRCRRVRGAAGHGDALPWPGCRRGWRPGCGGSPQLVRRRLRREPPAYGGLPDPGRVRDWAGPAAPLVKHAAQPRRPWPSPGRSSWPTSVWRGTALGRRAIGCQGPLASGKRWRWGPRRGAIRG